MIELPSSNLLEDIRYRLSEHLSHIARERDPYFAQGGHFYVQTYIQQELSQWGEVDRHTFIAEQASHTNWILSIPAQPQVKGWLSVFPRKRKTITSASHRPLILIGAHYDAVPGSPGADDNATGVAVLLELARLLSAEPARWPIQLVAFDLEEYFLAGSRAYASSLRWQQQPLRLMLSLEMLGYFDSTPHSQRYPPGLKYLYPNSGNFIGLIGNWQTTADMVRLSAAIRQTGMPCEWLPIARQGKIVPDTRRSDHAPFWDQGYRAIMVTDTADLRNPHYHQPSDRIDTLDLDALACICWGLFQGIRHL